MMKIFGAENGELTQAVIDYYRARAKGGAALITTGLFEVLGRNVERYPRIDEDRFVPGLQRLAEAIHSEGVPIMIQLHHGGSSAGDPISPSGVPCLTAGQEILESRAMRLDEIEEASKSEAEKTADRISKAEAEAATVPAKVAAALKEHLVALHDFDADDAELFLTADEPELLLKQATRLLGQTDKRQRRNHVPREGTNPPAESGSDMRDFARNLFGTNP
jgi:hypothetical protein